MDKIGALPYDGSDRPGKTKDGERNRLIRRIGNFAQYRVDHGRVAREETSCDDRRDRCRRRVDIND